jgi:hypothetical protein
MYRSTFTLFPSSLSLQQSLPLPRRHRKLISKASPAESTEIFKWVVSDGMKRELR